MILIIQFYIVFPLTMPLFVWVKGGSRRVPAVLGVAAVLYLLLVWLSYQGMPLMAPYLKGHFMDLLVKFRDRSFVLWFYYFLAGGVAGLYLDRWRQAVRQAVGWNTVLCGALLVIVSGELFAGLPGGVNLNVSTSLKPTMFLFTLSSLVLLYAVAMAWAKTSGRAAVILQMFGRYSTGAFFVHALGLNFAVILLSRVWPAYAEAPVLSTAISFVICVSASLVFAWVVNRLPGGNWLVGTVK
jgi:hypothetical protein